MNLELANKTALITGSTAGIGYAIAHRLAQEGANVILNGRTEPHLRQAMDALRKEFPEVSISGMVGDFRKAEAIDALLEDLPELDILVNNVGVYASKSFEETSDEEWQEMLEVNLMSGVRLSRRVLPGMRGRNWGRILFISSECAQLVPEDLIAYSCTKAAMLALSRGLAQTTKGSGVTVNAILPGSTLTEGAVRFVEEQAQKEGITTEEVSNRFFKDVRTTSILGRFLKPAEVADTAVFLCSPLSAGTNGAAIKVDGGSVPGLI